MSGIAIERLHKSYGGQAVLREFHLRVEEGRKTALMGPSGCGKTTLLRILMGLERYERGSIHGLLGRRVGVVFQEDRLCEEFSAVANVRLVCDAAPDEIRRHLAAVGLQESVDQPVRELSGGMRRRVAIVRAVLAPKDLLLLDEPFKGLDEQNKETVAAYLKENTQGVTTLMVTHDQQEVALMEAALIRMRKVESAHEHHNQEGNSGAADHG